MTQVVWTQMAPISTHDSYHYRLVTNACEYYTEYKPVSYLYDAESESFQLVVFPRILFAIGSPWFHEPDGGISCLLAGANILYPDLVKKSLYIIGKQLARKHGGEAFSQMHCGICFAHESSVYDSTRATYLQKADCRFDSEKNEFSIAPFPGPPPEINIVS